jgi:hypothetical protein
VSSALLRTLPECSGRARQCIAAPSAAGPRSGWSSVGVGAAPAAQGASRLGRARLPQGPWRRRGGRGPFRPAGTIAARGNLVMHKEQRVVSKRSATGRGEGARARAPPVALPASAGRNSMRAYIMGGPGEQRFQKGTETCGRGARGGAPAAPAPPPALLLCFLGGKRQKGGMGGGAPQLRGAALALRLRCACDQRATHGTIACTRACGPCPSRFRFPYKKSCHASPCAASREPPGSTTSPGWVGGWAQRAPASRPEASEVEGAARAARARERSRAGPWSQLDGQRAWRERLRREVHSAGKPRSEQQQVCIDFQTGRSGGLCRFSWCLVPRALARERGGLCW